MTKTTSWTVPEKITDLDIKLLKSRASHDIENRDILWCALQQVFTYGQNIYRIVLVDSKENLHQKKFGTLSFLATEIFQFSPKPDGQTCIQICLL